MSHRLSIYSMSLTGTFQKPPEDDKVREGLVETLESGIREKEKLKQALENLNKQVDRAHQQLKNHDQEILERLRSFTT